MKTKIYSLCLFAFFAVAIKLHATCTVTWTYTSNGLTISANAVGTGAVAPFYAWSWGDAGTGTGASATHTYSTAGTYTVCCLYGDLTDTSCHDYNCQTVVITASGIATSARPQMEISAMPNPFTVATSISVTLSQPEKVNIVVYDITGQQVATIYDGQMENGQHIIQWKPDGMADGIYFLQIKAGEMTTARKIVFNSGN